ncbi:peptidase M24 [Cantharellus anzutake]|uniref:peptidase M24 n=1 Tax=Cantharellus anzutake TaxID=1750568 RepID=UPI001903DDDB|nr:peptidase M24 [Cantharellus anzutake]KAF8334979.1 peptidase M24 [Cantharellus anzutake]
MSFHISPVVRRRAFLSCATMPLCRSMHLMSLNTPRRYGQPTAFTHPHLLKPNEITPGISTQEYESRRASLMDGLPDNSVVVSVAAGVKFASQNIFYKFRQSSDFLYLTGLLEPESAVILEKRTSGRGYHMSLFLRERDPKKELWDGPLTGVESAASLFGADDSRDIEYFPSHLKSISSSASFIYIDVPKKISARRRSFLRYLTESSFQPPIDFLPASKVKSLSHELHELRRIKSKAELELMRNAASISGSAHAKTMRFTAADLSESALAAHFEYLCALKGSERPAYVPVVASGANALVIHYTSNDQILLPGDLVLMDAGCEFSGYASDIRTFTPQQKELYQAVLNTLKQITPFATATSGHTLSSLHQASREVLYTELRNIGFKISLRDVDRLYPHFLSHPIGMDLHESNVDRRSQPLMAGMVITIEPGVYVPPDPAYPKHFHNIGIRLEDEVLVHQEHSEVLTVNAPKEIVDVEGACQGLLDFTPYWQKQ